MGDEGQALRQWMWIVLWIVPFVRSFVPFAVFC